jgi:hypothetical protein
LAFYEGRWDCNRCSHTGNLGSKNHCGGCGGERSLSTAIYLLENAPAITDPEEIKKAKALPDWNCDACGGDNDDPDKFCTNCGAERGARVRVVEEYKGQHVPKVPNPHPTYHTTSKSAPLREPQRARKSSTLRNIALPVGVIIFISILYALFATREVSLTVTGMTWERTVYVEESREVTEEDWAVPAGGSIIKSWRDVHHQEDVLDHYKPVRVPYQTQTGTREYVCGKINLGNGYFTDKTCRDPIYETRYKTEQEPVYRKKPVYGTMYQYRINRWFDVKNPPRSSGTDKFPYWPRFTISGNQRERTRSENYIIHFRDGDGNIHTKSYYFNTWSGYNIGKEVRARINRFGHLSHITE